MCWNSNSRAPYLMARAELNNGRVIEWGWPLEPTALLAVDRVGFYSGARTNFRAWTITVVSPRAVIWPATQGSEKRQRCERHVVDCVQRRFS